MMEEKLLQAARALPQPVGDFRAIEERTRNQAKPRKINRRLFRAAVAAVLALCLATTAYAYGTKKYGLWSGIHSSSYGDVMLLNWKYDYVFSEELWDLPFSKMSTYYGAPQGASHLEALLSPTYALHTVDYGDYSDTTQEDGTILRTGNKIHISFGTTETDTWKYHFSVGEDGFCDHEDVQPGSQSTVEYGGYTLYLYTVSQPSVRWEDSERNMVIDITCYGTEAEEAVVEIAKELIDLNRILN